MKREFGSKLIEQVLPRLDLSHVVDTSGAFIPGHGTPTVILFGRHRPPVSENSPIRTVLGIKGEPGTPNEPATGFVWSAILKQIDLVGSESEFLSVADSERKVFATHPWSIGGGGAAELKETIESQSTTLKGLGSDLGFMVITGEDNCLMLPNSAVTRLGFKHSRQISEGDVVRDWSSDSNLSVLWPYDIIGADLPAAETSSHLRGLWSYRTSLKDRKVFGAPIEEKGLRWWDLREVYRARLKSSLTITFGEITTHNHFVLDRGRRVFKQTAPVLKLPATAGENDYIGLLGLLNSSVACFWMKQVCFPKDGQGQMWEERFAFNATNIGEFPVASERPLVITQHIDTLTQELAANRPAAILVMKDTGSIPLPTRSSLDVAHARTTHIFQQLVAWQEELDWQCYRLYGLMPSGSNARNFEHSAPPDVALGERAFEIVLARRVAAGTLETNWFERHGSKPITDIPTRWPEDYRQVVQHRINAIEREPNIKLIEQPLCKRRWNSTPWEELEQTALREWLLERLESNRYWTTDANQPPTLTSTSRLADQVRDDADFMQLAAIYAGHADFDPSQLVAQLVVSESVPFLPSLRYTEAGMRKRTQWEDTWTLQRREDQIEAEVDREIDHWRTQLSEQAQGTFGSATSSDAMDWINQTIAKELAREKSERKANEVGNIPVPPKYKNTDFLKTDYWRLRGGLDVPKERWMSFPGCERGADGSLVIAWAGWDHLQQATALASYYLDMKDNEGWPHERLQPLLAGLLQLIPWLEQWHNEVDPVYGERMGAYYKGFVAEEARALGVTLDDLRAWKPVVVAATRGRRRATA